MSTNMQLWPSGRCVSIQGDIYHPYCTVKFDRSEDWRTPTDEERRAIRIEQLAEGYAARDILCCDSSLVTDLMRLAGESSELSEEWGMENVVNLQADPSDWTLEQCKEWLEENGYDLPDPNPWAMDRSELVEMYPVGVSLEMGNESEESLRVNVIDMLNDEEIDGLDDYREAVREHACEHEAEVYEWWRVNNWLAKRLIEIGEAVLDNSYGYWWGRTCTGQGLIMDGVLQKIAANYVD